MNIFADNARKLYECGLSIIPAKGKKAFLSYDKYRNQQCSESELAEWEHKYKAYNIGLVTGPASKLVMIDIDIKNDPELLSKALSLLPSSPLQRFGSKGLGIFVKYENQTGRKLRYKGREIGELIVNTQVVIPPSIHPDTSEPYKWTSYSALGDEHIDDLWHDLPSFTDIDASQFEHELENSNVKVSKHFFKEVISRNNRLKAICGALIKAGQLPEEMAARLVAEDLALHPKNPLFSDEREFKLLAKQPLACAYRFASSVFLTALKSTHGDLPQFKTSKKEDLEKDSEYGKYKVFFKKHTKDIRKCKISGEVVDVADEYTPLVNRLETLQSYARDENIPKTHVCSHLHRYMEEIKPSLLITIPKWDGKDHIAKMCSHVTVKGEHGLFERTMKSWLSGIFRRLQDPTNQNLFLILKGSQGIGKDTFVRHMLKGFDLYFSNFLIQPNREVETWHQVSSNLVLHLEEFDQSSKLSVPFLKALITTDHQSFRKAYERKAIRHAMRASFISTVNVDNIFRDSTGNRRFGVFEVEAIDWKYPKDVSPQIIAQAQECNYLPSKEDKKALLERADDFTPDDFATEVLEYWDDRFNDIMQRPLNAGRDDLKMKDVNHVLEDVRRMSGWSAKAILQLLKKNGLSNKRGGVMHYTSRLHPASWYEKSEFPNDYI